MGWFEELMYNGDDNEQQSRMVTHAQLSKLTELIDVKKLHAREVKIVPDDILVVKCLLMVIGVIILHPMVSVLVLILI